MSNTLTTRLKAIPFALRTLVQFTASRFRGDRSVHHAALEYVRANAETGEPAAVLAAQDEFARKRMFLMNVGDEKGPLLAGWVGELPAGARILELGSFVGYSAILMSQALPEGGHITSIDPNANATKVSQAMAEHAGVGDRVTFINGKSNEVIPTLAGSFDLVFLDHWKDLYLADTEALLEHGLLTDRAIIVADNVGPLFGDNPYVPWIQARDDFHSEYIESHIEYNDIEDGVLLSRRKTTT